MFVGWFIQPTTPDGLFKRFFFFLLLSVLRFICLLLLLLPLTLIAKLVVPWCSSFVLRATRKVFYCHYLYVFFFLFLFFFFFFSRFFMLNFIFCFYKFFPFFLVSIHPIQPSISSYFWYFPCVLTLPFVSSSRSVYMPFYVLPYAYNISFNTLEAYCNFMHY